MEYRPEQIGKLLDELEGKTESVLQKNVGDLMKRAVEAATKDVGTVAKDIAHAAADAHGRVVVTYFIEFVKAGEGAGDLWNFYAYVGKEGKGKFYRLSNALSRIVLEKKEPESLRLKKKRTKLQKEGDNWGVKEVDARLAGGRLRVKKVPRRDFERLFKTRNPLTEFGGGHFVNIRNYLRGVQTSRSFKGKWIEIVEKADEGTIYYVLNTFELSAGHLVPAKTYELTHLRDKDDFKVVYGVLEKEAIPLFRMWGDGEKFAMSEKIIPKNVNAVLLRDEGKGYSG